MSDLISRQMAIDEIKYELEMINSALDSLILDFNTRERLRQERDEAIEIFNSIQHLPSVEKHGHWITWESNLDNHAVECKCSACGHQFICSPSFIKAANYCPNCGTKMDGEEDDE